MNLDRSSGVYNTEASVCVHGDRFGEESPALRRTHLNKQDAQDACFAGEVLSVAGKLE